MVERIGNEDGGVFEGRGQDADTILVAQAAVTPADQPGTGNPAPAEARLVVEVGEGGLLRLAADASINEPRVNGADLEFVQPDGTIIVVPNGAIQGLTIFLGEVEIPPQTVAALFEASGIETAAGPEVGTSRGSGGNFEVPVGGIGDAFDIGGLLDPTALAFTGPENRELFPGNLPPKFLLGTYAFSISEEGLGTGLEDEGPVGLDTTNDAFYVINLGASDPNGHPLTFTLGSPTAGLTSNGQPIVWQGVGTNHLIGKVGDTTIIDITISGKSGILMVHLMEAIDHEGADIEDARTLNLTVTANDGLGGTATATISIGMEDDSPEIGNPDSVGVDEDGLAAGVGNWWSPGDNSGKATSAIGSLGIQWGADNGDVADTVTVHGFAQDNNGRSVYFSEADFLAFAETYKDLTSGDNPLVFSWAGATITATAVGSSEPVFRISLSDDDSGSYMFQLFGPLDHASDGPSHEDDIVLNFDFTAKDADGDTVAGSFSVTVDDDMPVLVFDGRHDYVRIVDEDDVRTGLSQGTSPNDGDGDGSYTGNPSTNAPGPAFISGTFAGVVNFGADGPGRFAINDGAIAGFGDYGLKSQGDSLSYGRSTDGDWAVFTARAGAPERTVFQFRVNTETGEYEFRLFDQLDHDRPGDDWYDAPTGADQNFDLQDGVSFWDVFALDFGSIVRAYDGDGDYVDLNNQLLIKVRDDVPELAPHGLAFGVVEEEQLDGGNEDTRAVNWPLDLDLDYDLGFLGSNYNVISTVASDNGLMSLKNLIVDGADEGGKFTARLGAKYSAVRDVDGNVVKSDGADVKITGLTTGSDAGGAYTLFTATAAGRPVFTLKVYEDGDWRFQLLDQLDHKADNIEDILALDLSGLVKYTDFDGDSVNLAGDSFLIKVIDDTPIADIDLNAGARLRLDETKAKSPQDTSADPNADDEKGVSNPFPHSYGKLIGYAEGGAGASSLFVDKSKMGADQNGTKAYALSIGQNNDSGVDDTATGQNILLFKAENGDIVGRVGHANGAVAFVVRVDANSGAVKVYQFRAVEHDNEGSSQSDHDESGSPEYLASGKIILTQTVTDQDGDQASDSIDIGKVIAFEDDGPVVSKFEAKSGVKLVLDESVGTTGSVQDEGGRQNNDETLTGASGVIGYAKLSGSQLFNETIDAGSDGLQSKVYALVLHGSGKIDSGLRDTLSGQKIILKQVGSTIEGVTETGGQKVFTITVGSDGSVTVNQFRAIKHNDPSDHDENGNDAESIASGKLSLQVTVTDGDGDTAKSSFDLGKLVRFEDDGPAVTLVEFDPLHDGLFFDGFSVNDQWGEGSGTASGNAGAWLIEDAGSGGDGPVELQRVGDGYLGMHSSTLGHMVDLNASNKNIAISQIVEDLVGGASYRLTFEAGSTAGIGDTLEVWFGGQLVESITSTEPGVMKAYTFDIVGGSGDGSNKLVFKETGSVLDNHGTYLANVSVSNLVIIDETDGNDAGSDDTDLLAIFAGVGNIGSDSDMAETEYAVGGAPVVTFAADFGSDGAGSVSYALSVVDGTPSGLRTTEEKSIFLFVENGGKYVVGRFDSNNDGKVDADDDAAFALHVNADGIVSIAQYVSLEHPDTSSHDEGIGLANNTLSVTVTVTDGDGDKATSTADISGHVRFEDDGPTITGIAAETEVLLEQETATGQFEFVAGADGASVTHINEIALSFGSDGWSQEIDTGHGKIKVKATGEYSFTASDNVDSGSVIDTLTYTVTDGDGDTDTASLSFEVENRYTGPSGGGSGSLTFDEDDLSFGTSPNAGALVQNAVLTFTAGTEPLTSFTFNTAGLVTDGDSTSSTAGAITWQSNGTGTLEGFVDGVKVITLTLSGGPIEAGESGEITVTATLSGAFDNTFGDNLETLLDLNAVEVVAFDGTTEVTGSVNLKVTDDVPVSDGDSDIAIAGVKPIVNAILVIDLSTSMNGSVGGGQTRLQLLQSAVANLLGSGDVIYNDIVIYTFNDGARFEGRYTMNAAGAISEVNSYNNGSLVSATEYDSTAADVANHFTANIGATLGQAQQTNLYFLTDGDPQGGSALDPGAERNNWLSFLDGTYNGNTIDHVYAVGFGGIVNTTYIAPMAPRSGDQAIAVTDANQLAATLTGSLPGNPSGNILDSGDEFGADGGHIASFTYAGVKFTFDGDHTIAQSGTNPGISWTINANGQQVTIIDTLGGKLIFNFAQNGLNAAGDWDYYAPTNNHGVLKFDYVLVDNDGDTASGTLTIDVQLPPNAAPVLALNDFDQVSSNGTVTENFANGYSGGSGWKNSWTENGETTSASSGDIQISSGSLRLRDGDDADDSIQRTVDLSDATSATLTFQYQRQNLDDSDDKVLVEVWDAANSVWVLVRNINGSPSGSRNDDSMVNAPAFDLTPYASANTILRFTADGDLGSSDTIWIDNINIAYVKQVEVVASATNYETDYTENGAAISIAAAGPTITDADDTIIASAKIVLTNAQAGDVLAASGLPAGITASINSSVAGQITLTLSGNASLAAYQNAIKAVTFHNTSDNPDTAPRVIDVTVNDGLADSNTATTTINVVPVNDAPTLQSGLTIVSNTADPFTVPHEALLRYASDPDGDTVSVSAATDVSGLSSVSRTADGVVIDDNGTPNGKLNVTVSDGSGQQSRDIDFVRDTTGALDGTSGNDIIVAIANKAAQISTITFAASYDAGDKVSITINGNTFTHTVQSGSQTAEHVYDALKEAKAGGTGPTLTQYLFSNGFAALGGNLSGAGNKVMTLTGPAGVAFAVAAATDNSADFGAPAVYRIDFSPDGSFDGDDILRVRINGVDYESDGSNSGNNANQRFDSALSSLISELEDNGFVISNINTGNDRFDIEVPTALGAPKAFQIVDKDSESETVELRQSGTSPGNQNDPTVATTQPASDGGKTLNGLSGDDFLIGSDGDDILFGGAGHDILIGGAGSDTMTGGTGADTFVIGADSGAGGIKDVISDYNQGEGDVVDLSELLGHLADGTNLDTEGYVNVVNNGGGHYTLQVDTNGGGDSYQDVASIHINSGTHILVTYNDDDTPQPII